MENNAPPTEIRLSDAISNLQSLTLDVRGSVAIRNVLREVAELMDQARRDALNSADTWPQKVVNRRLS